MWNVTTTYTVGTAVWTTSILCVRIFMGLVGCAPQQTLVCNSIENDNVDGAAGGRGLWEDHRKADHHPRRPRLDSQNYRQPEDAPLGPGSHQPNDALVLLGDNCRREHLNRAAAAVVLQQGHGMV